MIRDPVRSAGEFGRGAAAAVIAALVAAVGCSSESPSESPSAPPVVIDPVNGKYELFADSQDGRLYRAATDGGVLTAFGDRDGGVAAKTTSLLVQEADEVSTTRGTWLTFDADGRLARMVSPTGNAIDVAWSGDAAARVAALSSDGKVQVQTHAEPTAARAAAASTSSPLARTLDAPAGVRVSSAGASAVTRTAPLAVAPTTAQVVARLIRCGVAPAAEDVADVHMSVVNSTKSPQFPARPYDTGRYRATIPLTGVVPLPVSPDLLPICAGVGRAALRLCRSPDYGNQLVEVCMRLAGAMQAQLGATPRPPADEVAAMLDIADGCSRAVELVNKHCDELKIADALMARLTPEAAQAFMGNLVCQALAGALGLGDTLSQSMMVAATATLKGSAPKTSAAVDATAAAALGVQANISIDFGDRFQVLWFETNPADPGPGESYQVRMKVACAAGRHLVVTVKGTDGFHDANDYVPDTQGELFSMFVPGRPAMAADTIRLIDAADNSVLRTILLSFRSPEPVRSISGTVSGAIAANVRVQLSGTSAATTWTDAVGRFAFAGLARGPYDVTPQASGYTFSPGTRQVTVAGADVSGVSFAASQCPAPVTDGVACGAFAPKGCVTGFFCDPGMGYECKQKPCPTGAGWNYTHDCCCNCQGQPYQNVYDPCRAGYLLCCVPDGSPAVCR